MTRRDIAVILGAGRIGRALGNIIATGRHPGVVRYWDSQPGLVEDQQPLAVTLRGANVVLLAIPARALPSLADVLSTLPPSFTLVVLSKGIPATGYLSPAEYLHALCPRLPVVVVGGPMMAEEMTADHPGHAVIASRDNHAVNHIGQMLDHPFVVPTVCYDPVSVSRAGVLKNVYGCISGMVDGLDLDAGDRDALQTWLIDEFRTTALALGVSAEIIAGPAGLGDLAVTVASSNSRNRRTGETLVRTGERDERSEALHSLVAVAGAVSPTFDAPLLRTAEQYLEKKVAARDLLPLFTRHLPKAGPLYTTATAEKTGKKKYGKLPKDMPEDQHVPPDHAALVQEYETAGFHHVHIRHDTAKAVYAPHYHPHFLVLHVLEGELDVEVDGEHQIIGAGKKIDVPAERFHTTCVGPQGCIYLHAEKHATASL